MYMYITINQSINQTTSLPPLPHPRQTHPTPQHAREQNQTNRMQNPRANLLRQQAREEGRQGAARAPERRHGGQAAHLQAAGEELGEDGGGAGVDGAEEEADDGDGDGLADDVGHEPDEELEGRRAGDEEGDGALLAEAVRRVGEQEAAEGDARPEPGGDVADAGGRGGVPVGDEEGDDPARDGDLGALVAEDEEGAQDGGFVRQGRFEVVGARGRRGGGVRGRRGGGAEEVDGCGVLFVGAEGEVGEAEVEEGDG